MCNVENRFNEGQANKADLHHNFKINFQRFMGA